MTGLPCCGWWQLHASCGTLSSVHVAEGLAAAVHAEVAALTHRCLRACMRATLVPPPALTAAAVRALPAGPAAAAGAGPQPRLQCGPGAQVHHGALHSAQHGLALFVGDGLPKFIMVHCTQRSIGIGAACGSCRFSQQAWVAGSAGRCCRFGGPAVQGSPSQICVEGLTATRTCCPAPSVRAASRSAHRTPFWGAANLHRRSAALQADGDAVKIPGQCSWRCQGISLLLLLRETASAPLSAHRPTATWSKS